MADVVVELIPSEREILRVDKRCSVNGIAYAW